MAQPQATNNSGCLVLFGGLFAGFGFVFLAKALSEGRLDPHQPRSIFLSLTFVVIGIVIAALGKSMNRAARNIGKLAAQNPDKPWLWREDWAGGFASPEWRSTAAVWGAMGVLFLVLPAPSLTAVQQNWHTPYRFATLIILLFPLAGLYLLSVGARAALRESKFKKTRLALSSVPGVLGGRVAGNLETAYVFPPGTQVKATLSCVHSYASADRRSHWENALWQETQLAPAYVGGPGSSIPIAFTTPFDARETGGQNSADEIFWKLTAAAALPGIDFLAEFRVPVFKTPASDASLTTEKLNELVPAQAAERRIIEEPARDGGIQFHLAAGRNTKTASSFLLFGLFFLAGGIIFGKLVAGEFTWLLGAIPLFFAGGIGLALVAFGIWLWLGQTTVGVLNRSIRIRSSCLGFSRTRVVEAAAIRRFELYPGMSTADKIWYDLKLHLENGATITAGSNMEKSEAEWYLGELKKDLGMGTAEQNS